MASRARNGGEKTLEIGHGTCNADKPCRLGPLTRSEERVGYAQNDGPRRKGAWQTPQAGARLDRFTSRNRKFLAFARSCPRIFARISSQLIEQCSRFLQFREAWPEPV